MTLSSTLEAKLRQRGSSSAPADAAGKVRRAAPRRGGRARFSNIVHWTYGTSWGAVRGLLHAAGVDGPRAASLHFTAVWGSAQVMLPALDVAPLPWESEPREIAIDAFHHAVYAAFTALAFAALQRSSA